MKQDQEHQQQHKQRKKKQIEDADDDTVITKITQESSLGDKELECNLIDDEDNKYDNNVVIIQTQVILRIKRNLKWRCKRKQKWQKEKYSRKVKMKKKIASMISNVSNGYPTSDDDVNREHEIKGILKMID